MGTFFHPITLVGPTGVSETFDALVDTDVLFAVIPSPVLKKLGVEPLGLRRIQRRRIGQVQGELAGQRGHAIVVFGAARVVPRIGRHTLDSFVLDVGEDGHSLVPKILRMIAHAY